MSIHFSGFYDRPGHFCFHGVWPWTMGYFHIANTNISEPEKNREFRDPVKTRPCRFIAGLLAALSLSYEIIATKGNSFQNMEL
jgi:hypothetical protein